MLDYIRVASAVPPVAVGDAKKNAADICAYIRSADAQGCDLVVFPELALTGYTCADLFFQETLLRESMCGIQSIMRCSAEHPTVTAQQMAEEFEIESWHHYYARAVACANQYR